MSNSALKLLAASGATDSATYVDDVFSTFLYTGGLASPKVIPSGIDLSGEGGLVWTKSRTTAVSHQLTDTVSGYRLSSDSSSAGEANQGNVLFNSNGHSYSGYSSNFNGGSTEYASWTFRKAPGFFDVVKYTGNSSSSQTISHNLGAVPGMIITKATSATTSWYIYHVSLGNNAYAVLNATEAASVGHPIWNNTTPTSTEFTVGSQGYNTNNNGIEYVAYLFAHDAQDFGTDEDESIIKCGTYAGNSGNQTIDVGFEAQWVLIKNTTSNSTDWFVVDVMRGAADSSATDSALIRANESDAEQNSGAGGARICARSTGFGFINESNLSCNRSGETYIYMAIRRPHKPAEEFAATDLYATAPQQAKVAGSLGGFRAGFVADFALKFEQTGVHGRDISCRLAAKRGMYTNATNAEASLSVDTYDFQDGMGDESLASTNNLRMLLRRAPGFFDVVAFTGSATQSERTYNHNLGVQPELIIIKDRNVGINWAVATNQGAKSGESIDTTKNHTGFGLNATAGINFSTTQNWSDVCSATTFTTNGVGAYIVSSSGAVSQYQTGNTFIAYLFASVDGISKVGSYTGTGNDLNVDCGFSAGARFVMIKRTDASGDWYVWDSYRGIVAGNDPYLLLNSSAAQVTNTDYIDPLASGFTVTSSAPAGLNASSGTYIFYAIA